MDQIRLAWAVPLRNHGNEWKSQPAGQVTLACPLIASVYVSLAVKAALAAGEKALEASGGGGVYRQTGLERRLRDRHAGQFHPLSEKRQSLFTGRMALGLDAVEPAVFPAEA